LCEEVYFLLDYVGTLSFFLKFQRPTYHRPFSLLLSPPPPTRYLIEVLNDRNLKLLKSHFETFQNVTKQTINAILMEQEERRKWEDGNSGNSRKKKKARMVRGPEDMSEREKELLRRWMLQVRSKKGEENEDEQKQ